MTRPSTAKAGLIFVLYGLVVAFVLSLLVSGPLTLVIAGTLDTRGFGLAMLALNVVLRAATFFLLFVLALRLPFGRYRLRLVHKDAATTEVFS